MKLNRKGFTLIELLAVIVILALLVLIATPAITRIITNSTKASFKNEVGEISKNLDTAFAEKMNKTVKASSSAIVEDDTKVWNVKVNGNDYAYLCMSLKQMVDEQYIKKNLGESYGGYLQMWVPDGNGKTIVFANVTNGRYFIQGKMSQISNNDYTPSQHATDKITRPISSSSDEPTKCPTDASIPSDDVLNKKDNEQPQEIPSDTNN